MVSVAQSISEVDAEEWDACACGDGETNPFLLHAFLRALEVSGSACGEQGWLPQHLTVRDASGALVGCAPVYLKSHSYGEYVFDSSWASFAARMGVSYYPKLQCCVPFTPVTGSRLLVSAAARGGGGPGYPAVASALAQGLRAVGDAYDVSSVHVTFDTAAECDRLSGEGFLRRVGIQYHWYNEGYGSFDDFLMDLRQGKRKNIRQERKKVARAGLRCRRLSGADLTPEVWDRFYGWYRGTVDRKWGTAYLTRGFFEELGRTMGDRVLLVVAEEDGTQGPEGRLVAGALNLVGSHALFGRNWGCDEGRDVPGLHFEVCYYQALEAAIERGLPRVEAGAQGEHKIQRGYLPRKTYSSHLLREPSVRAAVGSFLDRERAEMEYAVRALTEHVSPFKEGKGAQELGAFSLD